MDSYPNKPVLYHKIEEDQGKGHGVWMLVFTHQACKSPNAVQMLAGRVGGAGKWTMFSEDGQWPGLDQL